MSAAADLLCGPIVSHDDWGLSLCILPDEHAGACNADPLDVHTFFGLSYASYLTVNRSLLQSMPMEWQYRFTAIMAELWTHFDNIEEPSYTVHVRDGNGRFVRDPIPHYNRGRTFVTGGLTDDVS